MKTKTLFVLATFGALLVACQPKSTNQNETTTTTVENLFVGTYEGTLPCADCAGVEMTITLNADSSFSKTANYIEKELTETLSGHYLKNDSVLSLMSDGGDTVCFVVGENQIVMLDLDGNMPADEAIEKYILKKK